jgi:AraC-like DNA-binding protein
MGMTVVQYIVRYRLDMADFMLQAMNKNVADIATACGFEDESYFYRCYKKHKGVSPKKRI